MKNNKQTSVKSKEILEYNQFFNQNYDFTKIQKFLNENDQKSVQLNSTSRRKKGILLIL